MNGNVDTVRHSAAGVWSRGPGGTGSMWLDPDLVKASGAVDRLVAAVLTVRALGLPGVVPVADLVEDRGEVVLLTGAPVAPTLADLVVAAGGGAVLPGAAGVTTAAADTGRTIAALHRAGVTHGSIGLDAAVVTAEGAILLNETSIAAALTGRDVTADEDVRAWASLLRLLAYAWAAGDDAGEFHAVARTAERRGLDAALQQLATIAARTEVDGGDPGRGALASAVAASVAAAPATPVSETGVADGGGQVTLLGRRAQAAMSDASGEPGDGHARSIRFGPGVPPGSASSGAGRPVPKAPTGTPEAAKRSRRRRATAAALTLAIAVAVGGWLWWQRGGALTVAGASVAPAAPPGTSCDVTVDIVGTIHTDGRGGVVSYQWQRSDGESSAVLRQTFAPGAHDAQVHLHWSFSGRGWFPAAATLSVIAPNPISARTEFTYACP